jgi:hypothetical protein
MDGRGIFALHINSDAKCIARLPRLLEACCGIQKQNDDPFLVWVTLLESDFSTMNSVTKHNQPSTMGKNDLFHRVPIFLYLVQTQDFPPLGCVWQGFGFTKPTRELLLH